jgi:hypothetical protein
MRNRRTNWMIAALLIFQLAMGFQWQVAYAVVASPERQMHGMDAGHCPGHQSKDSRTDEGGGAGVSTSAASSHNNPANKHECCRSSDCQCHYAQSPVVLDLPSTSAAFPRLFLLPVFDARSSVSRTTEFFRPPIA